MTQVAAAALQTEIDRLFINNAGTFVSGSQDFSFVISNPTEVPNVGYRGTQPVFQTAFSSGSPEHDMHFKFKIRVPSDATLGQRELAVNHNFDTIPTNVGRDDFDLQSIRLEVTAIING